MSMKNTVKLVTILVAFSATAVAAATAVRAEVFTGHDGHDPLRVLTASCDHFYGFSPAPCVKTSI
jgi:hypothetical protein